MSETKAKIDITQGTIELEGCETFVSKYLEEFKNLLNPKPLIPEVKPAAQKASHEATEESTTPMKNATVKKVAKKKRGAPKISAEKYDIHGGDNVPALKAFFDEKKPSRANGDRIAVIGYYITELLGKDFFTEGQIEYSYKMLNLDRPGHLHQIMINNKNEKDYYEEANGEEIGQWVMTRGGDIFVSDELPPAKSE